MAAQKWSQTALHNVVTTSPGLAQLPTQLYTTPPSIPTNTTTILNQITTLQKRDPLILHQASLPFVEIILEGIFLHWVGDWKMSAKIQLSNSRCSTLNGR